MSMFQTRSESMLTSTFFQKQKYIAVIPAENRSMLTKRLSTKRLIKTENHCNYWI